MKRDILAIDDEHLEGGAKIRGFLEGNEHWTGDFEFRIQDRSSLLGAARLDQFYQTKKYV